MSDVDGAERLARMAEAAHAAGRDGTAGRLWDRVEELLGLDVLDDEAEDGPEPDPSDAPEVSHPMHRLRPPELSVRLELCDEGHVHAALEWRDEGVAETFDNPVPAMQFASEALHRAWLARRRREGVV